MIVDVRQTQLAVEMMSKNKKNFKPNFFHKTDLSHANY